MTDTDLRGEGLVTGYGGRDILKSLDIAITPNSFTVIIGPNACGKSTLLRTLARGLKPSAGSVLLDGADISSLPARQLARQLGLLPQTSTAPDGITVYDLVSRGRYPHQTALRQWSREDSTAVEEAMRDAGVQNLAERFVDELSGGQRQRVWLALVLAQQTPLILLDEPTTYLDIAHQHGLLDLCEELRARGRTVVAVLHDLNQACRYATELVAMRDGHILARGRAADVITAEIVEQVYGLACRIIPDPETGTPLVIPRRRQRGAAANAHGSPSASPSAASPAAKATPGAS